MADTGIRDFQNTLTQENNAATPADLGGEKRKNAAAASEGDIVHMNGSIEANAVSDQIGLVTGDNTQMNKVTLIWNGGNKAKWTYRNITASDSHIEINDVWLFGYPINVTDSYFEISGRFNGDSWRGGHVLSVYEMPCTFTDSELVVEGSRINVVNSEGLTLTDSTVTVKNSPDGGFNVNYGAVLNVHNSVITSENVRGALIAAGYNDKSSLRIDGSSVIETAAASQDDSVGANGDFIVTGGTYKVFKGNLVNALAVPTNGTANGNEKLTYFTLADSSVKELEPVNAVGGTYLNVTGADDTNPTEGYQEETVNAAEMKPGSPEGDSAVVRRDTAVRTGDPAPILLYILLVLMSGGALAGMLFLRKKKHR